MGPLIFARQILHHRSGLGSRVTHSGNLLSPAQSRCPHDLVGLFPPLHCLLFEVIYVFIFSVLSSTKDIKILIFIWQGLFKIFCTVISSAYCNGWHSSAQEIRVKYTNRVQIRNIQPALALQDLVYNGRQTSFSQSLIHLTSRSFTNPFSFHPAPVMRQGLH